jgi:hypothetical protein
MENELKIHLRNARDLTLKAICTLERLHGDIDKEIKPLIDYLDEYFRDTLDTISRDVRRAIDRVDEIRIDINCLSDSISVEQYEKHRAQMKEAS